MIGDRYHQCYRSRSKRRKRALTFHLDPVDGSQLVFATIMLLGAGIVFAMTIDSIRVGTKYGFFPVPTKFSRFFPLELGHPLNAPSGIIYPPNGYKEPEEIEPKLEENNGGGSYGPPKTNGKYG
jgi:hypothetical protein